MADLTVGILFCAEMRSSETALNCQTPPQRVSVAHNLWRSANTHSVVTEELRTKRQSKTTECLGAADKELL